MSNSKPPSRKSAKSNPTSPAPVLIQPLPGAIKSNDYYVNYGRALFTLLMGKSHEELAIALANVLVDKQLAEDLKAGYEPVVQEKIAAMEAGMREKTQQVLSLQDHLIGVQAKEISENRPLVAQATRANSKQRSRAKNPRPPRVDADDNPRMPLSEVEARALAAAGVEAACPEIWVHLQGEFESLGVEIDVDESAADHRKWQINYGGQRPLKFSTFERHIAELKNNTAKVIPQKRNSRG